MQGLGYFSGLDGVPYWDISQSCFSQVPQILLGCFSGLSTQALKILLGYFSGLLGFPAHRVLGCFSGLRQVLQKRFPACVRHTPLLGYFSEWQKADGIGVGINLIDEVYPYWENSLKDWERSHACIGTFHGKRLGYFSGSYILLKINKI